MQPEAPATIVPVQMSDLSLTVRQVAQLLGATLEGDGTATVAGISSLENATGSHISFLSDKRHFKSLAKTRAGAVIVGQANMQAPCPLLRVENVPQALVRLLTHFSPGEDLPPVGIHPSAVVSETAILAESVSIGPCAVVGSGARIGRGSVLCANVSLGQDATVGEDSILFEGAVVRRGCQLGNRVRVGPNSVIGFDGFGYYHDKGIHHRIPHVGIVVLEDDVELGACTCVDRAKFGTTRVGAGSKIDNQVQIAHNVQVGRGCLLAAQAGIAGSTEIGEYVLIGGGVGVRDNIKIGNGAQCSAFAGVANNIDPGEIVFGMPASLASRKMRELHALTKLPDLLKKVRELESRLNAIESAKDD